MGFYEKYFTTLLKGPLALKLKERFDVTIIESAGGKIGKFEKRGPELAEKEHKITAFLDLLKSLEKSLKKGWKGCFAVIFNQLLQDMKEIEEADELFKELGEIPNDEDLRHIKEKVVAHMISALNSQEGQDRGEYRQIEGIIKQSDQFGKDKAAFMAWLKTLVKEKTQLRNVLERVSWKMSISASTRNLKRSKAAIKRLKKLAHEINRSTRKETDPTHKGQLIKMFEETLVESEKDIVNMFKESYLVKQRALLMLLKILYTALNADIYLQELQRKNFIPKASADDARKKIAETIESLGKDIHDVIAQEFRIVIHKLESAKKRGVALARAS